MCQPVSENIGSRSLRSAVGLRRELVVPVTRTARYGPDPAALLWSVRQHGINCLPASLRDHTLTLTGIF